MNPTQLLPACASAPSGRTIPAHCIRFSRQSRQAEGVDQTRAMTLIEVMIAMGLFAIVALAAVGSILQTRKMAEDNAAQATAAAVAQSIIEQVHLASYTSVVTTDITDANYSATLPLRFLGISGSDLSVVQNFNLPWASDSTTFTAIGERVDPTDPSSAVLGILLDLDYKNGATVITTRRYMPMAVNLQRIPHPGNNNVEFILTYRWQPASRRSTLTGFITRELRTVRSEVPSY